LKSSLSERENILVSLCLEGRGSFIAGRRLDNYKLFISIFTKKFTLPVGLDLENVGWRLSWCSDLFWSLSGSLLLFPGPSTTGGGGTVPGSDPRDVA
jgi:hypothetical protein